MCYTYEIIEKSISDIRALLSQRNNFCIPDDNLIINSYKELAVFIISNFKLPYSRQKYIFQNLNLFGDITEHNMLLELEKEINGRKDKFNLEFPLRALEAYFSYGKPNKIDIDVYMTLKYLISKLHHLVGENYRFI